MQLNAINRHLPENFRQPEKITDCTAFFQVKNRNTVTINVNAIIHQAQIHPQNRAFITDSTRHAPMPDSERQRIHANNIGMLADLWHEQNLYAALTRAEMLINTAKTMCALYCDFCDFAALNVLIDHATNELTAYNNSKVRGKTPEQNRADLGYLEDLISLMHTYSEFVPEIAVDEIALYNTGIQILSYYNRLMNEPAPHVAAAFAIIRGASVESSATKYQLKPTKLREETLKIGQILYRIAVMSDRWHGIQAAEAIPQLRATEYRAMTDLPALAIFAQYAKERYALPFEYKFGMSMFKWSAYSKETCTGYTQISRLLNNKQSEEKWDWNAVFRQPENVLRNPEIRVTKPQNFVTKPDFHVTKPA